MSGQKTVVHSPVYQKRKHYLSKLSDEELLQMLESISDPESDLDNGSTGFFDDDDGCFKDPAYGGTVDDEAEIDDCIVEMKKSSSADYLSKAISVSLNLSNISSPAESKSHPPIKQQEPQGMLSPEAGSSSHVSSSRAEELIQADESVQTYELLPTDASSMPVFTSTDHVRLKGKRRKRPRSPPPEQEEGGPDIQPDNGGITVNPANIEPKSEKFNKITWRKKHLQLHRNEVAFCGEARLPVQFTNLKTPFQCFQYFFNDELLEKC